MAKFKVGDKVRVRRDLKIGWSYGEWCFNSKMKAFKGGELTIKRVHSDMYEVEENIWKWTDEMLEEVKEDKMEKTFREVIADIKEGEVWESKDKIVRCLFDGIQIYHKDKERSTASMLMLDDYKFTLQRKEYTFEEAFKAYEEGKEIESVVSKYRYKLKDKEDLYVSKIIEEWVENTEFDLDEIRGKWYIND